jgi:hypothetical protein
MWADDFLPKAKRAGLLVARAISAVIASPTL